MDKNEKPNINISNISINSKKDNSTPMKLPEIDLKKYQEHLSINAILELFDNIIIGSKIFPAYLNTALKGNEEDLEYSINYFDILFSIYKNMINSPNNNSLVYLKMNEYISSFQEMVITLKNENVSFIHYQELNSIENKINNKNSFITLPEKIESESSRPKDEWNKDEIKQYINNNNINDFPQEEKEKKDIQKPDKPQPLDEPEEQGPIILKEPEDIKKEEKKQNPENNIFNPFEKGNEENNQEKDRREFEKIEKNFNEDFTLEYIVNKIENLQKDTNKNYLFNYETKEKALESYVPNCTEIAEGENFPIIELMQKSRFLTSKIYTKVAQFNYNETDKEIPFKNIEAHILFDVARTITIENRYFIMFLICGLASALNSLKIPYSLSLIGDSKFKVRLKEASNPHQKSYLQKLYDCCFIKRNITPLASCLKHFLDKDNDKDGTINKIYYIFSNGYDYELIKYDAWQKNIFNNENNSFSFIFLRSQAKNLQNIKYLEKIWDQFASIKSTSQINLTKISLEEIRNINNFIDNLSSVILRKKREIKDNSPKYNSLFEIKKSLKLTKNDLNSYLKSLENKLTKSDDLFIRRVKLPPIFDNQKDDKKEFKNFCKKTGKIIKKSQSENQNENVESMQTKKLLQRQSEIKELAKSFKEKRERMKLFPMNIIFKPNLPTQAILVEEGTHLDITELIKYSINKVPNPKLYREIRDGFIKNYGVSIILDTSTSCLNEICMSHTLQTLKILFSAISHDNIPCLDVIISREKEPIILASEKSANEILSENSMFWGEFFSCLKGENSSDLASAIKAAYNLNRARRKEYTNYIFVLTDGLFSISERDRIIEVVNSCYSKNINLFGIGVGIFPIGIEKLFPQVIYSPNPYKLIEGISLFFGNISKYKQERMNPLIEEKVNGNIIKSSKEINNDIQNPVFKNLKKELFDIKIPLESFPFVNINGKNKGEKGMYRKNLYLGQKILFAMFFSWDLETQKDGINTEEEKKVHPKYVKYNDKFYKDENIYSVLKYYGYEIEVVTGYEKAILELRRKDNNNNKCIYNSLWVISGKEVPEVPNYNKTGDPNDPFYVNQFVDCAIKFWQNGGSLVLMAENEPYTFQINLILKKLVFPDGKKVKFEIGGNHPGGKILYPDKDGKLNEKQTFNAKIQEVYNNER